MSPVVAKASTGVVETFQADKTSKNKRKFQPDPPTSDPNNSPFLSNKDLPLYKLPSQKPDTTQNPNNHSDGKTCASLSHEISNLPKSGLSLPNDDLANDWVDWALQTTSDLEILAINNLETMLKGAIKKIIAFGYNEELVNRAVLRVDSYLGNKDMVSNIIDNTISFIQNAHENDFLREIYFEDLKSMDRHILSQLVRGFCELKPEFSIGDAFWLLLLGDMSIIGACSLVDSSMVENSASNFTFSGSSTSNPCSQNCAKTEKSTFRPLSLTDENTPEKSTVGVRKERVLRQKPRNYGPKCSSLPVKITKMPLLDRPRELEKEMRTNSDLPNIMSYTLPLSSKKLDTKLSLCPSTDKDVILMTMKSRERALKEKLEKWDEWAMHKVMQATKRLGKDKAEVKALRKEREETERARREKKSFEENTMKKLFEMDNHLRRTAGQIDRANLAVRRLEGENVWLRREMEAARESAREAAARLREGLRIEKEGVGRVGKWEKEKGLFQEEILAEKRKREQLDKDVKLAKIRMDQQEVRLKQEEKAKDQLQKEASSLRKKREELEALTKQEKLTIKADSEGNLAKYKDEIAKLEKEISDLRLKNDASKIAALRKGVEKLRPEEPHIRDLSRRMMADIDDVAGIKRDRECAMCLSDERIVIFLPCSHQVLCKDCNEIHEKQGVKDCPSCRTIIQQRICVRYASH